MILILEIKKVEEETIINNSQKIKRMILSILLSHGIFLRRQNSQVLSSLILVLLNQRNLKVKEMEA